MNRHERRLLWLLRERADRHETDGRASWFTGFVSGWQGDRMAGNRSFQWWHQTLRELRGTEIELDAHDPTSKWWSEVLGTQCKGVPLTRIALARRRRVHPRYWGLSL